MPRKIVASVAAFAMLMTQSFFWMVSFIPVASAAMSDGFCNAGDATITAPASGSAKKGTAVTVGWSFNGIDCTTTDPSVFSIEASHDGGTSWSPIATSATASSTSVNFDTTAGQTPDDSDYQFRLNKGGSIVNTTSYSDVIIDNTTPTLTSVAITKTSGLTNDTTPTLTLVASDALGLGTMDFSCDNITYSSQVTYASTHTSFDLNSGAGCTPVDGAKTVYARVYDLAGNISSVQNDTVTLDTTAPTNQDTVLATSVIKMGSGSTAIVTSLDITNNVWLAASGTTTFAASSTMTKAVDGTSTTILAPADAGVYHLFVVDAAGNISTQSTATVTVDNTAPTVTLSTTETSPTKNSPFSVTATFSEEVTGFDISDITVGNGTSSGFVTVSGSVYTFDVTPTIDGAVTIDVALSTSTDIAGNDNTAALQLSVTSDTTAPIVTAPTPAAQSLKTGSTSSSTVASNEDANIYLVKTGELATTQAEINTAISTNKAFTGKTNATAGNSYTVTLTGTLLDGVYDIVAVDPAGNVSSVLPGWLTVDNTAPANQDTVLATSVIKMGSGSTAIVTSLDITNNVWLAASGTTTFAASSTMTKAVDGTSTTILAPADAGVYHLFVVDAAGNISTQSTATVTVDNTAPTTPTLITPAGGEKLKGGASYNITWTGSTDDNFGATPIMIEYSALGTFADTVTVSASEANDGTYSWTVPMDNVTTAKIRVTATDIAGNTSNASSPSGTTIDSTAPAFVSQSPVDNTTGVAVTTAPSVTFSEAIGTGSVNASCNNVQLLKYSDNSVVTATCAFSNSDQTITITPTGNLTPGTQYYIAVSTSVTDVVGNTFVTALDAATKATHEFTTVSDVTAPTLSSITPTAHQTGGLVNPVVFTFSDNMLFDPVSANNIVEFTLDGNSIVGSSTFSGTNSTTLTLTYTDANLPVGTHNFIAKVKDNAGNITNANAVVVVNSTTPTDTLAPVFVSSTPSNAETAVSVTSGTATVTYGENLVLANTGSVMIRKASNLSSVATGSVSVTTTTLSVPYATLEYNTTYRITVQSGALTDTTGNVVMGDRDIYFTTQSASAPDITSLSIDNVSSSSATLNYTTDVTPDTKQYRLSTVAYSGSWTTLSGSPATLSSLAANTTYYYQVRFVANGQTVNSVPMNFRTAASSTGVAITGISRMPHGDPVVGGNYTNGYHFRFYVTANSLAEDEVSLKLADWSNGVGTLAASGNTTMVVSQSGVADYAAGSGSAVAVTNAYGTDVIVSGFDADATVGGRQFVIDLFYKIPAGAGGVYSTSYGIRTQNLIP